MNNPLDRNGTPLAIGDLVINRFGILCIIYDMGRSSIDGTFVVKTHTVHGNRYNAVPRKVRKLA